MPPRALTPTEHAVGRLAYLETAFLGMADGFPPTEYVRGGGSLSAALREIEAISGPSELDQQIASSRDAYMDVVLTRPTIWNRVARKQKLRATEAVYVDSITAKISAIIDAEDSSDALAIRQMPTLVEKTSFESDKTIEPKDFAANHLYVLLDAALQEHAKRREIITENKNGSVRARILGNRVLHLAIAGGIFVAAFVPEFGIVPTPEEFITHDIELGLKISSASIICLDAPEVIRLRYLQGKHDKRTRELKDQLAESQRLSDLTLRMAYSSPRYGSSNQFEAITDRFGTSDKTENLRRFKQLDENFDRLHGDPGGKPYTGEQAIGYSARFLIERSKQLEYIIRPGTTPEKQKELYLKLCRDILHQDLDRMKKGLTVSRYRKDFMKMIAVVPAILFPSVIGTVNDASTLGRDTSDVIYKRSEHDELED